MNLLAMYIVLFFVIFLALPVTFLLLRFILWLLLEYCGFGSEAQRRRRAAAQRGQGGGNRDNYNRQLYIDGYFYEDRQGNAFPPPEDNSRESRYNDIFFIEPNSVEAARIRAQLEKDDKDLPSYEDVIRMTSVNANPPNSALATMTASNASVNTTETILSVPPYSEVDPNASSTSLYAATALPTTPPPFEAASVVPITLSSTSSSSVTYPSSNV